ATEDRAPARTTRQRDRPVTSRRRRAAAGRHGRHRAGGRSRRADTLPARRPHRPARRAGRPSAWRRAAAPRQRDPAHAAARDRAVGAGDAGRRRPRRHRPGHVGMSALLVTGTDTGVGKTFVACALAQALRARGRTVAVMKPVETGVVSVPEDAERLRVAAADPAPLDDVWPYRPRPPAAPPAAARVGRGAV